MTEQSTTGTGDLTGGQPAGAPQDGASTGAPGGSGGQPGGGTDQTATGGDTGRNGAGTDVVFDPETYDGLISGLPDEMQAQAKALKKQLLSDYHRKTEGVADLRKDAEAYRAFRQDPHGTLQAVARQLGYDLSRQGGDGQGDKPEGWNPGLNTDPESWQDVGNWLMQQVESALTQKLGPLQSQVQTAQRNSLENQLNEIDPSWRSYEQQMIDVMAKHPTLAQDPGMLYRMSVPSDVLESRATQRALKKMEQKAKSSQLSGTSTTNKRPGTKAEPDKPLSFAQSVEFARKKLAEEGVTP